MVIEIATDCTGVKQQAIKNVFSKRYNTYNLEIIVVKGESFQTPLTQPDFPLTALKRFQSIKKSCENPDVYIVTIQKGYYYSHDFWFFAACVGIAYPLLCPVTAMTSSVPVGQKCSEKKSEDLSRNMSEILKEKYPEWDKENGSVYTLLTDEDETEWLEQPLRHCLRMIHPQYTMTQ